MEKWSGKVAVVTGASAGIGEAIVKDFVKYGIDVVALARRMDRLEKLKEELKDSKGKVIPVKCDVSNKESIDAAFKEIEEKVNVVHILVNNAGIAIHTSMLGDEENIEENITNTINTNFLGLVIVTRKAYKLMKKSEDYGMIINIGSVAGHSNPFTPYSTNVYPSTKYAVRAVTDSLRHELIKLNNLKIRVCELSPGAVDTEIFDVGGWNIKGDSGTSLETENMPFLSSADVSQTVILVLSLPYNINISQMLVKPVGEKY